MPEFKSLDQQFDRALERTDPKRVPALDPYGSDALATDHFLLQRGWAYFHERIRLEEEQWEKIVKAKEAQIALLKQETEGLKSQVESLSEKDRSQSSLDFVVRDLHLGEYVDIKKKTKHLYENWEEERQNLNEKRIQLEVQLKGMQDEMERRNAFFAAREADFLRQIKSIDEKAAKQLESMLATQKETLTTFKYKDDELHTIQAALEIQLADCDRKSLQLKEQDAEKQQVIQENTAHSKHIQQLNEQILAHQRHIEHLQLTVDIKEKEIAVLRSDMARQQAEWREWWAKNQQK